MTRPTFELGFAAPDEAPAVAAVLQEAARWITTWRSQLWDPALVGEAFVKVGVGRDFDDTAPNKGVYRGKAKQEIFVRVETRQLDVLPALTWQEQLPPLSAPLVVVASCIGNGSLFHPETEEQQQQQ